MHRECGTMFKRAAPLHLLVLCTTLLLASASDANGVWKMFAGLMHLREAALAAVTSLVLSLLWRLPYFQPLEWQATLSNGTHAWAPTVLLISLDGFKPAYLRSGRVPTLKSLSQGRRPVSLAQDDQPAVLTADYMLPVSPSLTFPNHWSLQTGLQPSSHGVIANDFHIAPHEDGRLRKNSSFYYTDPNRSWDAKWWKGSPIWEHLERMGIKTANLMWPGPPVTQRQVSSTHFQRYEKGWTLEDRHDRIMSWLDMRTEQRPQFISGECSVRRLTLTASHVIFDLSVAYAPDVDTATHNLGPDPKLKPVASALQRVDHYIRTILEGIAKRNASSIVNVIIVSDHGMTFTSNSRLLYLDDILGPKLFSQIITQDGWPNAGMRFRSQQARQAAEHKLREESRRWKARGQSAFDVADRQELLQRWNWTMTDTVKNRVADLWMLPSVGWSITTQEEMTALDYDYIPRG